MYKERCTVRSLAKVPTSQSPEQLRHGPLYCGLWVLMRAATKEFWDLLSFLSLVLTAASQMPQICIPELFIKGHLLISGAYKERSASTEWTHVDLNWIKASILVESPRQWGYITQVTSRNIALVQQRAILCADYMTVVRVTGVL